MPDEEYLPLLVVLHDGYSARQLAALVAEFTGRERVVVDNDHAKVVSGQKADRQRVAVVRSRLAEAGYDALDHDEQLPFSSVDHPHIKRYTTLHAA